VPLATKIHASGIAAAGGAEKLLTAGAVRDQFVIFIGAGAVAAAGLYTVLKTAPTMVRSLSAVIGGLRRGVSAATEERTDRDLPAWVLAIAVVALVAVLAFVPGLFAGDLPLSSRIVAALGVALFGFLFVPVSSRLVGLIGVSSNPTSAMALITIAGAAGAFLAFGWKGTAAMGAVLTVGTVVCVAASKAGDISQDLKTGWLVGATPARQQFGQLIAAAVACWAVAAVVIAIGKGEGFGEEGMPAPQARLMRTVVEAVLGDTLPWDLLLAGAALSLVGTLAGLPALPFALGIYLPLSTMAAIFVGGCVRKWIDWRAEKGKSGGEAGAGVLCASGFVAGEGLAGVLIAGWAYWQGSGRYKAAEPAAFELAFGVALLALAAWTLARAGRARV
jgi:putative OPT family oligopeptide transporter